MSDINSVILTGRLTRDPETKQTGGGMTVCEFSLAVSDWVKNEDVTYFVDCVMFGKRAEAVGRFVTKGSPVTVSGKLKQERWEAKDGQKRSKLSVLVNDINFSAKREDSGQQEPKQSVMTTVAESTDEDVPF